MMKYEIIKKQDEKQFGGITGVKRATFHKVIEILKKSYAKKHDFRLFKESGVHAGNDTEFETDTGYTGITAIHPNSILPKKRSKNTPLTK